MLKKIFIFITVLIATSGCKEKFDPLKFEKGVAYEIFPILIDSLHYDNRVRLSPPEFITNEEGKEVLDTIATKRSYKEFDRKKEEFYKDTVKLVTAIEDSTLLLNEHKYSLLDHFSNKNINLDSTDISFKYKIELSKLKADNKIVFKYRSEFPQGSDMWRSEYDFYLNSLFLISRIQFDQNREYGVLIVSHGTGFLNGGAYRVFIKKIEGKWIIDELDLFEIS